MAIKRYFSEFAGNYLTLVLHGDVRTHQLTLRFLFDGAKLQYNFIDYLIHNNMNMMFFVCESRFSGTHLVFYAKLMNFTKKEKIGCQVNSFVKCG